MNIVFVSKECPPSPRSCGIGTYVWETGSALARFGHNVTIIAASDDGQRHRRTFPRITLIRLPMKNSVPRSATLLRVHSGRRLIPARHYRRRVADCIERSSIDNAQT